jgi:nucleoside phosphorylase
MTLPPQERSLFVPNPAVFAYDLATLDLAAHLLPAGESPAGLPVSRFAAAAARPPSGALPAVDWTRISRQDLAPKLLDPIAAFASNTPLPSADVAVVTWTGAEWNALSMVLTGALPSGWQSYGRGFVAAWPALFSQSIWGSSGLRADTPPSLASATGVPHSANSWGFFRLVRVGGLRVLLFKSQMHIASDGVTLPLIEMTRRILADTGARLLISAGTSGATQPTDRVGDVAVSNGAHIELTGVMSTAEYNGRTFQSSWRPDFRFGPDAEVLMLKTLAPSVLAPAVGYPLDSKIQYADGDRAPKIRNYADPFKPVLTTNAFDVATNDPGSRYLNFCCLEMDDGLLAMACGEAGRGYCSVRNFSDPVMNKDLNTTLATALSSYIYGACGTRSSYNGALAAWALIAALA